jgi:hypothetical protein
MAFDKKNFSGNVGAGSGSLSLYVFQDAASTKAAIATADYFLTLNPILKVNDVIIAGGSDGSVVLAVTASTSSTVTVEEATLA